jgi:hypothetical protein
MFTEVEIKWNCLFTWDYDVFVLKFGASINTCMPKEDSRHVISKMLGLKFLIPLALHDVQ